MQITEERRAFPVGARIAGGMWIAVGVLGLCGLLWSVTTGGANPKGHVAKQANQRDAKAQGAGEDCGYFLAIVIYVTFSVVGIKTVRGTAKTTLGNGIGSLVLSLPLLGLGASGFLAMAVVQQRFPNRDLTPVIVASGLLLFIGLLMIVAGILGIVVNGAYKDWRRDAGMDRPKRPRRPSKYDEDDVPHATERIDRNRDESQERGGYDELPASQQQRGGDDELLDRVLDEEIERRNVNDQNEERPSRNV